MAVSCHSADVVPAGQMLRVTAGFLPARRAVMAPRGAPKPAGLYVVSALLACGF
jgi:hypothetical protein